jgi:hypothetical protein
MPPDTVSDEAYKTFMNFVELGLAVGFWVLGDAQLSYLSAFPQLKVFRLSQPIMLDLHHYL